MIPGLEVPILYYEQRCSGSNTSPTGAQWDVSFMGGSGLLPLPQAGCLLQECNTVPSSPGCTGWELAGKLEARLAASLAAGRLPGAPCR